VARTCWTNSCHPLRRFIVLGVLWLLLIMPAQPAAASIHTYHEQPGQTTLRSRQSLRDQSDLAWQATLFKRYRQGAEPFLYLRLVGFPGQVAIDPGASLQVKTGTTLTWSTTQELDPQIKELPENVAQYRVDNIFSNLKAAIPLTLLVPLQGSGSARLVVAPFVVQEWLQLNSMAVSPLDLEAESIESESIAIEGYLGNMG